MTEVKQTTVLVFQCRNAGLRWLCPRVARIRWESTFAAKRLPAYAPGLAIAKFHGNFRMSLKLFYFNAVLELVNAIKQGNESAFEQAFFNSRDKVYLYFYRKTGTEEDARDLLQNTFLRLWQYRHSMNEAYSLDQHLFNIAKTVYIDFLRKRQLPLHHGALPEVEAVPGAAPWDVNRRLHRILDTMPPTRQKAFILNRLQGYSYKEVADSLSISVKAVENHIAKAVKQLKKSLLLFLSIFFFQ